jgi:transposase
VGLLKVFEVERRSIVMKQTMKSRTIKTASMSTVGIDLGDKFSHYCVLNRDGLAIEEGRIRTTPEGFEQHLAGVTRVRIAIETGTHSAWVDSLLRGFGHEVLVANTRHIAAISGSDNKADPHDAETLARLARLDPKLLHPIKHRSLEAQADLTVIRARAKLVEVRTTLINTVRSTVKGFGARLPKCVADSFHRRCREAIPADLRPTLAPLFALIENVSQEITNYDRAIDQLSSDKYPETAQLRTVPGVGPIASLTFVLTLGNKQRFERSRDVGSYLGLRPKRSQSGNFDPQLRITKAGDTYLRKTLVQCAQYILGPFAPNSAIRKWGLALCTRGGKSAKRRAIVAVARKLSILLHRLWVTQQKYCPFPNPAPVVEVAIS